MTKLLDTMPEPRLWYDPETQQCSSVVPLRPTYESLWDEADMRAYAAKERAAEREACAEVCREVAARYPTDVFPDDGQSIDCKSARMARLTAANIERLIAERSNEKGSGND